MNSKGSNTNQKSAGFQKGGERISYGAQAIVKGGIQSQPKMMFPGGLLIWDDAGTLNLAKIKGAHTATKSDIIAAECIARELIKEKSNNRLDSYWLRAPAQFRSRRALVEMPN